jgi:prepilin-type N-terminal cleavage/methylation domain-containing protein
MQNTLSNRKGFTMLELLISVAILSLIMLATVLIFSRSFGSYQRAKALEKNVSEAQFVMNLLSKELRTGTVVLPTSPSASTSIIKFFDHSRGACIQYAFTNGNLEVVRVEGSTLAVCNNTSQLSGSTVTVANVAGSFAVVPSTVTPQSVGRVTITVVITSNDLRTTAIETTTSLRDYGYIGL